MPLYAEVEKLQNEYGWNILPLGQFIRKEDGKKEVQFLAPYTEYRDKMYPIENFKHKGQHILIMTGKISNLTVVDIDSVVALQELEEYLQDTIDNYCEYIVATSKGFQLFYTYEPSLKSVVKYQNSDIDVLSDNYQTFASPLNPAYTLIKGDRPAAPPQKILDFFSNIETINKVSENIKKSNESYYINPFIEIVEQFINASSITKKLKNTLEEKFCKREFEGAELTDFGKGNRSTFLARVAAVLSSDPTVDKVAYEAFMTKFNQKFTKMEELEFTKRYLIRYTENKATFVNAETGEYLPIWSYNPEWELEWEKHKSNTILSTPDYKVWRDLEDGKYVLYHIPSNSTTPLAKQMLIDQLKYMGENIGKEGLQTHMFPSLITVFDPTKPAPFFKDEYGREHYNSFKRSEAMEYFIEATPQQKLPDFIGKVLDNIFPEEEVRDLFLHNLAHHLRYLKVGMTSMICIGTIGGEGKGVILDELMSLIYGKYFVKVSTKTFTANFNGELDRKLFIYLDESDGKFNDKLLENLKRVIGNSTYELRVKNKGTYDMPNNMMITISSNKNIPVTLDSNKDRRFNVSTARKKALKDYDWFQDVKLNVSVRRQLERELHDFLAYLAGLDTNDIQYSEIIENSSRKQLKEDSYDNLTLVVDYLMKRNFADLRLFLDDMIVDRIEDEGYIEISKIVNHLEQRGIKANRRISKLVDGHENGRTSTGESRVRNIKVGGRTHRCLDLR